MLVDGDTVVTAAEDTDGIIRVVRARHEVGPRRARCVELPGDAAEKKREWARAARSLAGATHGRGPVEPLFPPFSQ